MRNFSPTAMDVAVESFILSLEMDARTPPTSLQGVAVIAPDAPRKKRPVDLITPDAPRKKRRTDVANKILAKMLLYSGDEIYQRFMDELRTINVTPAVVEAKRERHMRVLMSLR